MTNPTSPTPPGEDRWTEKADRFLYAMDRNVASGCTREAVVSSLAAALRAERDATLESIAQWHDSERAKYQRKSDEANTGPYAAMMDAKVEEHLTSAEYIRSLKSPAVTDTKEGVK